MGTRENRLAVFLPPTVRQSRHSCVACRLQVKTALDLCSDYMISLLTFSNADEILHIADMYSLDRVKDFYTNKVLFFLVLRDRHFQRSPDQDRQVVFQHM